LKEQTYEKQPIIVIYGLKAQLRREQDVVSPSQLVLCYYKA
jgi:hypothetical protein